MRRAGIIQAAALGLAVAGVGVLLGLTPGWRVLEEGLGQSWLFHLRGPIAPPDEVRVVALDRVSAERLGLPARLRDWPRDVHAALVDRLAAAGASVIAIDLIFERPRADPDEDAALADAIGRAGRVVLLEFLDRTSRSLGTTGDVATTLRVVRPIPRLAERAAALAPFPLPRVPERVNHFWTFLPGPPPVPTLPAVAAEIHIGTGEAPFGPVLQAALDRAPVPTGRFEALVPRMGALRERLLADAALPGALEPLLLPASSEPAARRPAVRRADLYAGPDARWINFYGPSGQIPTWSAHTVLESRRPEQLREAFAGRAVFIGLAELLDPHADDFVTVFSGDDGVDLAGVEIAATAFANLLDGRHLEPLSGWPLAALLVAVGILGAGVAALLPPLLALPFSGSLALGYGWLALLAFHEALWLPLAIPLLVQLPLGLMGGLLLQVRASRRAERNLASGLAYYLPPALAQGLAEQPLLTAARTEAVEGVCFVSDVEHFTRRAEARSADEVSALLNRYFEVVFDAIGRGGGRVTDIVGDGVTAFWPGTDNATRLAACRASLAILRAVAGIEITPGERGLPTRIGLNTGRVMLGGVGGSGRFAYSVIGDPVNTASRIEQLNKRLGTRLLASAGVTGELNQLLLRPVGRFVLHGKREPIELVEVLDEAVPDGDRAWLDAFADALVAFRAGRVEEAAEGFSRVLAQRPDGPSRFYLALCRRANDLPVRHDGGSIVLLEK